MGQIFLQLIRSLFYFILRGKLTNAECFSLFHWSPIFFFFLMKPLVDAEYLSMRLFLFKNN